MSTSEYAADQSKKFAAIRAVREAKVDLGRLEGIPSAPCTIMFTGSYKKTFSVQAVLKEDGKARHGFFSHDACSRDVVAWTVKQLSGRRGKAMVEP